jgi:hypothetical protein
LPVKPRGHPVGGPGPGHILDDDDPRERQRILSRANFPRRFCLFTSKALNTSRLTIRVDLDSE